MEQILVVVASTQMRTLRTEAGKVFMWTVFEHELVDTKNQTKVGFFQSKQFNRSTFIVEL